jgi:hypothetical protein
VVWDKLGFHHGSSCSFMGLGKVPVGVSLAGDGRMRNRSRARALGTNLFVPTGTGCELSCKGLWDDPWCPVPRCDPYRQGQRGGLCLGLDRREEHEDFVRRFEKKI